MHIFRRLKPTIFYKHLNIFSFCNGKKTNLTEIESPEQIMIHQFELKRKELEQRHRELQLKLDEKLQFPLKLYGTKDSYEQKFSYLPERIMGYYQIYPTTITDFLMKIFKASLYAIANNNTDFMNEYWEKGLQEKVQNTLQNLSHQNIKIKVQEELNVGYSVSEKCEIVDSVIIRGLSTDRKKNQHPSQYRKSVQSEQIGLITYTPLYLTQNNEKFINPETNKTVYKDYDQLTLRALVRIQSPLRISMKQYPIQNQIYTWQHLLIMQNTMVPPPEFKSSYKLETYLEWLGKFKFGLWRVVDIDNYMHGNGLFRQAIKHEPLDPIFKGSKLDKSTHINIRQF